MSNDILECVKCNGILNQADDSLHCKNCGTRYPIADGILDFLPNNESGNTNLLIRKLFEWLPPIYQSLYFPLFYRIGALPELHSPDDEVREIVERITRSGTALDVACGPGKLTRELAKVNESVFGLDLSMPMLRKAVQYTSNTLREKVGYIHGNAERLPFRDDVIDVLTCSGAFYFFPDLRGVLDEFRRVLKQEGHLAGMTVVYEGIFENKISRALLDIYGRTGLYRVMEVEEVSSILRNSGFRSIQYNIHGCIMIFHAIRD